MSKVKSVSKRALANALARDILRKQATYTHKGRSGSAQRLAICAVLTAKRLDAKPAALARVMDFQLQLIAASRKPLPNVRASSRVLPTWMRPECVLHALQPAPLSRPEEELPISFLGAVYQPPTGDDYDGAVIG